MKAIVYEGPRKLAVMDVPKPQVGPRDLLIEVKAAGICGSDLEMARGNRPDVIPPRIPGHEVAGEVAEVGGQTTRFQVGDRVVVEPIISCGICRNCRVGRYNVCRELKFVGVHIDGAFAEYLAVPEQRAYKIPDHLSYGEAAVLEPTAVGVHIVERAKVSLGDTVVVLGAGPIGLQIGQVAKNRGARYIMMTDVLDYRLEIAKKLAADLVINSAKEDPLQRVNEVTDGEGADVVIEAVGKSETILQTMDLVRVGGRILLAGLSVERFATDPPTFWMRQLLKEVTIETSRSYAAGNWDAAIKLVSRGAINCEALVTHRFPLEQASRAYEVADGKLENSVKVLFTP
ncbi:MAG: alcohol dehydrogenase catalytic domain-containing protein [Candidatus Bathyarchaeota archaeon]|nr:alcohol dehydrogenase catalytic domain-containing protein [Candidatus Bathyarchaeota archaeon]